MTGIYKIQSIIKPEKFYIGSAVNLDHRKRQHLHQLRHDKHFNKKLQNHYNKYGESDLVFSVLFECNKDILIKSEQYYIDTLKPIFNNAPIAGSCMGVKHSIEIRKRLSERQKGRKLTEEHKKNIGNGNKGKILSEETKKKISDGNKGKKLSEETKEKIKIAHYGLKNNLGKKWTEEQKKEQSKRKKGIRTCPEFTNETKEKIRVKLLNNKNNLGKKLSDETKKKIGLANSGHVMSEEQKEYLRKIHKGKKLSDETKAKMSKSRMGHKNYYHGKKAKSSAT